MQYSTIPNFSRYACSSDGKLYSIVNNNGSVSFRQLHNSVGQDGYIYNRLICDDGRKKIVLRGRLVLLAFMSDCYFDGAECDHINRDTTDNRLENLRWLSHRDNCRNRRYFGREKDREIYLVYDDGTVEFYQCRKTTNICSPTLSRILSGCHSQKYKCRGFYADRLFLQSEDVQRIVRDSTVNSIADSMIFVGSDSSVHNIFDF